jgi:hypothetical protein
VKLGKVFTYDFCGVGLGRKGWDIQGSFGNVSIIQEQHRSNIGVLGILDSAVFIAQFGQPAVASRSVGI